MIPNKSWCQQSEINYIKTKLQTLPNNHEYKDEYISLEDKVKRLENYLIGLDKREKFDLLDKNGLLVVARNEISKLKHKIDNFFDKE